MYKVREPVESAAYQLRARRSEADIPIYQKRNLSDRTVLIEVTLGAMVLSGGLSGYCTACSSDFCLGTDGIAVADCDIPTAEV